MFRSGSFQCELHIQGKKEGLKSNRVFWIVGKKLVKNLIKCEDCGYVYIIERGKWMKCTMVYITREPQDCTEDKCYFWDFDRSKCKWMSTKWKNWFAKNADIQWHSIEDLNTYITATITFVNSIRHLWQEKDDKNEWW